MLIKLPTQVARALNGVRAWLGEPILVFRRQQVQRVDAVFAASAVIVAAIYWATWGPQQAALAVAELIAGYLLVLLLLPAE